MKNLMSKKTLKIVAVVAALTVLGAVSAVVLAQTSDAATAATGETAFLAKVAANLGIEESALVAAMHTAREQSIDEALAAGRITEEQAAAMKERLATTRAMAELIDEAVASGRITQSQADQMNRRVGGRGIADVMGAMRDRMSRASRPMMCGKGMMQGAQP